MKTTTRIAVTFNPDIFMITIALSPACAAPDAILKAPFSFMLHSISI